jgi:sec-independent protein translocase protein TatB
MFPENRLLELMIIGAVALIVVGPKDLPLLMRRVGQFVGRMRAMAAEFRASFDELARQSELEDLRKEVDALRSEHRHVMDFNPMSSGLGQGGFTPPEPEPEPGPAAASAEPIAEMAEAVAKPPRKPRVKKPAGEAP